MNAAGARLATLRAGCLVVAILIVDQTTKALVRADVPLGEARDLFLGVDLVHTRNTGVAFSLFAGGGGVLIAFTVIAVLALLVFFLRAPARPWAWLAAGLLAGGAVGNLIDRVRVGSVTDFIDVPYWPAFNFADIAITVGVAALLFVLERRDAD